MKKRSLVITGSALAITALASTFGSVGFANATPTPAPMSSGSMAKMTAGSDADVSFAQMMIPHHQQAIQMADLALKYAKSPKVIALAQQIKSEQNPEISMMKGWLKTWGAPMSTPTSGSMPGMDMTSPGMMSDADMSALAHTKGAAFDAMWLQMMTAHHQGAITDARAVLKTTKNTQVKALAHAIITGQSAEIATMKRITAAN